MFPIRLQNTTTHLAAAARRNRIFVCFQSFKGIMKRSYIIWCKLDEVPASLTVVSELFIKAILPDD